MKFFFLESAWPSGSNHPVYRSIIDHRPEGWDPCATEDEADLVIVPTRPWYNGTKPWVLFIEDWVTLYHDDIVNGATGERDILHHPRTFALRILFGRENFRGIVCHHRGTFADLSYLHLTDKLFYFSFGIAKQIQADIGTHPTTRFVFINSYGAQHFNFTNRGGHLVLRAFKDALKECPDIHLTVCCAIPPGLSDDLVSFIESCPSITHITGHLREQELYRLIADADCLLLPSHRVHVHSILLPFSFGIPVISSDGWGNDEYVIDGINGFRVPGIFGKTSWRNHILQEDYSKWPDTLASDEFVKDRIIQLHRDRRILKRLGREAREYSMDVHSVERMRRQLGHIFHSCLSV